MDTNRASWIPVATPDGVFGAGRTERVIEIPWAQSWLGQGGSGQAAAILDIGFALSDLDWLAALLGQVDAGASVTAVDIITPERVASRYPEALREKALRTPVIIGDVRTAPVPVAAFDVVTCISTIEHVGFDAKGSTDASAFARWDSVEATPDSRDPAVTGDVMAAIGRALRPGGLALVTVPMARAGPCLCATGWATIPGSSNTTPGHGPGSRPRPASVCASSGSSPAWARRAGARWPGPPTWPTRPHG